MGFGGIQVISFESRRSAEMEKLIRNQGGEPFVAPSMREVPLDRNDEVFRFAERLFAGEFDMVILLTGVGTRALDRLLSTRYAPGRFAEALRKVTVLARGPKPAATLREMNIPVAVSVPAPNTWRELLDAVRPRSERRIAFGLAGVVMFTTANQVPHLFRIAVEEGIENEMRHGLGRTVVASIGPTTSEMLEEYDIQPDIVPSQSKMGFLIKETAERASAILESKRASR